MGFKVYSTRCNQCLFSEDRIVSNDRAARVLADCAKRDSFFICHKATLKGEEVCCRAFYDNATCNLIRILGRLRAIEFVDLPEEDREPTPSPTAVR